MSEALCIANCLSGNREHTLGSFSELDPGLQVIAFQDFIRKPEKYIRSHPDKVIVAGGDGTIFTTLNLLSQFACPSVVFDLLALGTGTENVLARTTRTLCSEHLPKPVVQHFLTGQLPSKAVAPLVYSQHGEDPQHDPTSSRFAFWMIAGGVLTPGLLSQLEEKRSIKNPFWRRIAASLGIMPLQWDGTARVVAPTLQAAGKDIAFLSHNFPHFTNFIHVSDLTGEATSHSDYVVRIGKEHFTKAQTLAGLVLDVIGLSLFRRTMTGTLHAVPIQQRHITLENQGQYVVVDSELQPHPTERIYIDTKPRPSAGLKLAYIPKHFTQPK